MGTETFTSGWTGNGALRRSRRSSRPELVPIVEIEEVLLARNDLAVFHFERDAAHRIERLAVPRSPVIPPQYEVTVNGIKLQEAPNESEWRQGKVDTFCGGGGLVGTIDDYWAFAEMLRAGGSLRGQRLLSPRTLKLATANHLPGDLASMATEVWAETQFDGVGFGLLGSVVLDPAKAGISAQVGDCGWGGAAGTFFWVSPVNDLVVILFTQLLPSSAIPVRKQLLALVHGALTGA